MRRLAIRLNDARRNSMSGPWSRRRVLGVGGALAAGGLVAATAAGPAYAGSDPWRAADAIRRRVRAPRFPRRDHPVTAFGAKGDGVTDCTRAFERAIGTCARLGGGRV